MTSAPPAKASHSLPSQVFCFGGVANRGGPAAFSSPFPLAPYTLLSRGSIFRWCLLPRRSGLCDRRKPGTGRKPRQKFLEMNITVNRGTSVRIWGHHFALRHRPKLPTARQTHFQALHSIFALRKGKHSDPAPNFDPGRSWALLGAAGRSWGPPSTPGRRPQRPPMLLLKRFCNKVVVTVARPGRCRALLWAEESASSHAGAAWCPRTAD